MANGKKDWTVMVYLAGDNDLGEDIAKKLMEMRNIFDSQTNSIKTNKIGLLAYFDGDNPLISTQQFDFTKGVFGKPTDGVNCADPLSVSGFVEWCVKTQEVTADNYALIFCGHGEGFQRTAFLRDMSSFDFMTVKQLKDEISEINKSILGIEKLQVLAFDSCVMSMIEVVNEFKDVAEVFVGAEGYMPTTGLSYKRLIDEFIEIDSKSEITTENITSAIVSATYENNKALVELTNRSLDIHVLDLKAEKFDSAVESINDLGGILEKALTSQNSVSETDCLITECVKNAILNSHWKAQTFLFEQAIDVIDFCGNLKAECFNALYEKDVILKTVGLDFMTVTKSQDDGSFTNIEISEDKTEEIKYKGIFAYLRVLKTISQTCEDVISKVGACVTKSCFSGPDYQFSNGVALFFPWSANTFEMTKFKFMEYDFASADPQKGQLNPWYSFLRLYLDITLRPPFETVNNYNSNVSNFNLQPKHLKTAVAGRVLLDPPPRGQITSENQYKEYFMRTKNFPLQNVSGYSKQK